MTHVIIGDAYQSFCSICYWYWWDPFWFDSSNTGPHNINIVKMEAKIADTSTQIIAGCVKAIPIENWNVHALDLSSSKKSVRIVNNSHLEQANTKILPLNSQINPKKNALQSVRSTSVDKSFRSPLPLFEPIAVKSVVAAKPSVKKTSGSYHCDICNKNYTQLKRHHRTHTGSLAIQFFKFNINILKWITLKTN